MPCQNSSHLLVLASRKRKARGNPASSLNVYLGHPIDSRSEQHSAGWYAPVYTQWEQTYQTHWLALDRPRTGAATVALTCPDCGSAITLRVRSQNAILRYYLIIALIAGFAALGCCLACGHLTPTLGGAMVALYLSTYREVLGDTQHHSPANIIAQSRAGHWLFKH